MKTTDLLTNLRRISIALLITSPIALFAQEGETYGKPSYWRPYDQTGLNMFETGKTDTIPYTGPRIRFGAGFTQQLQNLEVKNTATNNQGTSTATAQANKLYPVTPGFMTAQANLYTDIQLADGIRLNLTTYLSARHHNEAWVKGGFIQFDKLPFKGQIWKDIMSVTTIKVGHTEINYGDAHFRRSDGGHTLYNPFMESYIMDAFATEIGGEVYVQKNGLIAMLGLTNGMIKGHADTVLAVTTDSNTHRNPSIYGKLGFDKTFNGLRVRLTGSLYRNSSSAGSGLTLYGGDRTGSNYQNVMEKWVAAPGAAAAAQASTTIAFSGRFNPGFSKEITAGMLNLFIKKGGAEFFGTYESAKGRAKTEKDSRKASQYGIEGIYRFGKAENLFAGVRYNAVEARLAAMTTDVKIDRTAFAAGWFVTKNVLMKGEYVTQKYKDFLATDYRNGGEFKGWVIEAVVGF